MSRVGYTLCEHSGAFALLKRGCGLTCFRGSLLRIDGRDREAGTAVRR